MPAPRSGQMSQTYLNSTPGSRAIFDAWTAPPPRPNKRQHDSVGWTLGPNALRHAERSCARGHGDGRLARRLKKTAASDRLRQLRIR